MQHDLKETLSGKALFHQRWIAVVGSDLCLLTPKIYCSAGLTLSEKYANHVELHDQYLWRMRRGETMSNDVKRCQPSQSISAFECHGEAHGNCKTSLEMYSTERPWKRPRPAEISKTMVDSVWLNPIVAVLRNAGNFKWTGHVVDIYGHTQRDIDYII